MSLNVCSENMGRWAYCIIDLLLKRTFPHTTITYDQTKKPDLVVLSHRRSENLGSFNCPYICWSGEPFLVEHKPDYKPIFELNTFHCNRENSIYIPHLIYEIPHTYRPSVTLPKKYCCSYAFSNRVLEREILFKTMRSLEPTCYAFGSSCFTNDNPFVLPRDKRQENDKYFKDFVFNVAMENSIKDGYITEKIGYAFLSGSIPIYGGHKSTIERFFNPESFINVNNFTSIENAARFCIEVFKDSHKIQKYLDAPITTNNLLADYEAVYAEYRPWQKPIVDILQQTFPDLS
jgi:hypothetical protein